MKKGEIKSFLDFKVQQYNTPGFIETDPIQIPHKFSKKEDIEISGFLTATIAWGNRKSILNNASGLMDLMDNAPYEYVMNHEKRDLQDLENFVHRTFNGIDLQFFITSLKNIYKNHGGMEEVFSTYALEDDLQPAIHEFRRIFFEQDHPERTRKHISDPYRNSAAKRINMFLRWMIRKDNAGVDFGIWSKLNPSQLSCPLDIHSGNTARKLGILSRKQNDARGLKELDTALRKFDPVDPVKYDFALFGLGVFEKY
ncbi:MAG TPA: TIGR02757 family protein [Gillisia sp.]|nr:TIGR02757 family protein [Gillisia sp.]